MEDENPLFLLGYSSEEIEKHNKSVKNKNNVSGDFFEIALVIRLSEIMGLKIVENQRYIIAESNFRHYSKVEQNNILQKVDEIHDELSQLDEFFDSNSGSIELLPQSKNDARDIKIKTDEERGISAKNKSNSFRSPRISTSNPDFLSLLTDNVLSLLPPDQQQVQAILSPLETFKGDTWEKYKDQINRSKIYEDISQIIYNALLKYNKLHQEEKESMCYNMFKFVIGMDVSDYYHIKNTPKTYEITPFNFNNTLPENIGIKSPKDVLIFMKNSLTYLEFDNGYLFKLRPHTASSRIQPSLKIECELG